MLLKLISIDSIQGVQKVTVHLMNLLNKVGTRHKINKIEDYIDAKGITSSDKRQTDLLGLLAIASEMLLIFSSVKIGSLPDRHASCTDPVSLNFAIKLWTLFQCGTSEFGTAALKRFLTSSVNPPLQRKVCSTRNILSCRLKTILSEITISLERSVHLSLK